MAALGKQEEERIEVIGRYTLHTRIGVGGMAAVHLGWLSGAADFSRVVAIKRMHPQFTLDEQSAARFRDEAWLSSRLVHPNIVQVLDVVEKGQELLIVMEYVHGVSVAGLLRDTGAANSRLPPGVVAGILVPALHGLHAAHEATDDEGRSLGIVHRDFSPQNILVSVEGHSKILDFGIAKARTQVHVTRRGLVSGKFGYFAPEQALAGTLDRRTDVFAAGIVLWEMLVGDRLFGAPGLSESAAIYRVLNHPVQRPSAVQPEVPDRLDAVVLKALERAPDRRFASARELAFALEAAVVVASPSEVSEWVARVCAQRLGSLSRMLNNTRQCRRRVQLRVPTASAAAPASAEGSVSQTETVAAVPAAEKLPRRTEARWLRLLTVGLVLVAFVAGASFLRGVFAPGQKGATVVPPAPPPAPTRVQPRLAPAPQPPVVVPAAAGAAGLPGAKDESTHAQAKRHRSRERADRSRRSIPAPRAPRVTVHAKGKGTAKPDCDPPTYLDPDGIRIFKEECL